MKIIIYNNAQCGYEISEASYGTTQADRKAVLQICGMVSDSGNSADERRALRFSRLGSEEYILSVIFRDDFSDGQTRTHNTVINYIFSEREADALFLCPFRQIEKQVTKLAESLVTLELTSEEAVKGFEDELHALARSAADKDVRERGSEWTPDEQAALALFMGAAYGRGIERHGQVFIVSREASNELTWLMGELPRRLRKTVSFFCGAASARETRGVALIFCDETAYNRMGGDGFSGAESSNTTTFVGGELKENIHEKDTADYAKTFLGGLGKSRVSARYMDALGYGDWHTYHAWAAAMREAPEKKWNQIFNLVGNDAVRKLDESGVLTDDDVRELHEVMDDGGLQKPAWWAKKVKARPIPGGAEEAAGERELLSENDVREKEPRRARRQWWRAHFHRIKSVCRLSLLFAMLILVAFLGVRVETGSRIIIELSGLIALPLWLLAMVLCVFIGVSLAELRMNSGNKEL